jgi:hypothetical protein
MSSVPPVDRRSGRRPLALIVALLAAGSASCSGDESPGPPARTAVAGASETEAPVFSERDLDAFERGLRREIEAVHAAHRQSSAAGPFKPPSSTPRCRTAPKRRACRSIATALSGRPS